MIDKNKVEMIAQLIEAEYDVYEKLKHAFEKEDLEELNKAKKELLDLKNKIGENI